MIELPKRSVTRFFIPLIDVLILLFCIYLLLPIVKTPAADAGTRQPDTGGQTGSTLTTAQREELERLRSAVAAGSAGLSLTERERQEVEQLRHAKAEILQQRLAIRVLEIDPDNGRLYAYDPERVEIGSEAAAHALIERQKREATGRELYYLILFPRKITGFPEERQIRQYDRWFHGVAHSFDNPRPNL